MKEQPKPRPDEWWVRRSDGKRFRVVGIGRDADDSCLMVVFVDEAQAMWVTRYRDWSRRHEGEPLFVRATM